jgi:hypothetical protein
MVSTLRFVCSAFIAAVGMGCPIERLDPGAVGHGVAQLAARDVAILTSVVSANSACGFSSTKVLGTPKVDGTPGSDGSVTWKVEACEVDFGDTQTLSTDCHGTKVAAGGRVVVSATKTVRGLLTGDASTPVVPSSPDAVQLDFSVTTKDFWVKRSTSAYSLKHHGSISWTATPHLAVGKTTGVCSVPTSELTVTALSLGASEIILDLGDHAVPVDVEGSTIEAQFGKWGQKENSLEGSITLWGAKVLLPSNKAKPFLDPDYDAEKFVTSYACNPELQTPISFSCPSLDEKLALGSARLSVATFATMVSALDGNLECGFSSAKVVSQVELKGAVGVPGGQAIYRISQPCRVTYADETAVKSDCHGLSRFAKGTIELTGTKTVNGILTGDPETPIIPTSLNPVKVEATLSFDDFIYSDSTRTKALAVKSGRLSGTVAPTVALDTTSGACSMTTAMAEVQTLTWRDGRVTVGSGTSSFGLRISGSNVDAQTGTKGGKTNYLAGSININGSPIALPTDNPVLDPEFDPVRFEESYSCKPNLRIARTDEECSFVRPLAEAAARLLVQNAGAITSLINRDDECGYEKKLLLLDPDRVVGDNGDLGLMEWSTHQCRVGNSTATVVDQNCAGTRRVVSGFATVDSKRTVTGERDKKLLVIDTIIPRTRAAMTMSLGTVKRESWSANTSASGASAPAAKLLLHKGTLTGTVIPILGENRDEPNTFDVATPVAVFKDLRLTNASATLTSGRKTFHLQIPELEVSAQNGSFRGVTNALSGRVTMGATDVDLGPTALDPAYDQKAFDGTYACTSDLAGLIPPK